MTLSILAFATSAQAQSSLSLAWNPVAGNGTAGYRLYQGGASLTYTNVIAPGIATTATVSNLLSGATYYFAVTVFGTNGLESPYSIELSYTVTLSTNGPSTMGLVAHWPLDEGMGLVTADTSGGSRTGTLTGGASWTAGKVGSGAVAFDGVSGRMTFTAQPLTNTFTVAMWIYPVPGSANYGTLFAEGANKGIWYRGGSRQVQFYPASQASQTALTENLWHHVAVVCNAGNITYYLDGVMNGTATGGVAFNANTIGSDPASETFKGQMDEVRVYNRALSAVEVAALLGATSTGLVAHWPLTEGTGLVTADTSGGGRTGTLTGGASWTAGKVGSGAVAFDGVSGRMTFTALPLTNTFTVAMWIYPVPGSANYGTLFAEGANKGIWYRGGSRQIQFYPASQASQTALTENLWHHVAVVCNAGNITYYLDGVTNGTATGGVAFNANTIGSDPASETFKGQMDGVRVYNRALSTAEVTALASPTLPMVVRSGAPASLAARAVVLTPVSENPPSLAIVKITPEEVVVALRVDGSQSYIVQASADLVGWVQLTNVTTAGTHLFTDLSHSASRFYRVVPSSMTQ